MKSVLSRARFAASLTAAAACAVLAVGVAPASAVTTDLDDIVINEVESNNDLVNGDWIELYNTGAVNFDQVNVGGVILSDNDNSHKVVIPANTFIGVGEARAFRVDNPSTPGNFGLGSADSARVFAPGTVNLGSASPVDSYTWSSHAATTYGASPDGSNTFLTTAAGTFSALNDFGNPPVGNIAGVKINEVESNGDLAHGDWVELYNSSNAAIDIDGAIITDSDPAHQFVVPASEPTLPAGGYTAFRVDDPAVAGNFGLGASDAVKLYAPNDVTLSAVVDQFSWANHATVTYGRTIAGAGVFAQTSVSTFKAANQFAATSPIDNLAGVVINEVESHGDDTHGDWIELKNTSGSAVTLDGAILSDNDNGHAFVIPNPTGAADTTLAAGAVKAYRVDDPALGNAEFGLGDADSARLFASNAVDLATAATVDSRSWSTHAVRTLGLDGSGIWTTTNKGTFNAVNDFSTPITADFSDVVLNEVVSTGDTTHGDWVELLNTSGSTVDIGGAIIADQAGNAYTIPGSVPLAAGDTWVLQTENTGGFGLGKDDGVRLYRAGATVGSSIPVDHHEWEAHAVGSWARQGSGFGAWIEDATPSYDAAN